ncbi:MAG: IS21 family transposase [Streptosporangiaceae bacterium]
MRKIRDVLRLALGEELSQRLTSLSASVPQTTVHDYLVRAAGAGLKWPLPADLDDAGLEALLYPPVLPAGTPRPQPDWQQVHKEMRRKGVTLQLLWVEYREAHQGDGYGYSQFANLYRSWREGIDVSMRQTHAPGEKLFVDFPGDTFPVYDPASGEVALRAELFVAVPGASSYVYAEAFPSQELAYWVTAHVHCFETLGGCPAIVVPDNLRSAVTSSDRYEPDVNATFAEMAAHYGVAIIPARPYKPRDKAKAESGVLLAERWIIARLRGRRFTSLDEANAAIAGCAAEINARPFQKLDGSRAELFGQLDRPALRPLPASRYELATWRKARAGIDYHIAADAHYYSVPYQLARQQVDVRLSAATVEVFHRGQRVASHPRSRERHRHTTDPAHMPESHRQHAAWTPQRITEWAAATGPSTAALAAAILASRPHPQQGYRAVLGIIRLAGRYDAGRVEAACARALRLRSYSYRSVSSILATGLDRQPLPGSVPAISPHPAHGNLRGPGYYQ